MNDFNPRSKKNNDFEDNRNKPKEPSFSIKHRVDVNLDLNLALDIGDFIVACKSTNPAIMAFGLQLQNLVPAS